MELEKGTQQLRARTALLEDVGLVPGAHARQLTAAAAGDSASSLPRRHLNTCACICAQACVCMHTFWGMHIQGKILNLVFFFFENYWLLRVCIRLRKSKLV